MKTFAMFFLGVCVGTVGATAALAQEDTRSGASQPTTAQSVQSTSPTSPQAAPTTPEPAAIPAVDKSKIVYVTDFELDAVEANGKLEKSVAAVPPSVANTESSPRGVSGPNISCAR